MKAHLLARLLMANPDAEVRLAYAHNCTPEIKEAYLDASGDIVVTNMPPLKYRDVRPADLEAVDFDFPHAHELINHKED